MKVKLLVAALAFMFTAAAHANCGNDKPVGTDCSGGSANTASGGSAVAGAASNSTSSSAATSVAGAASIAGSVSNAAGGAGGSGGLGGSAAANASNGTVSNSVTTGSVRALSLGAAAVGSPAAGTCAAHMALAFGLATIPVELESCTALQEALALEHFGLKDAAVARLCQLKSIEKTGVCPAQARAAEAASKE